MGKAHVGHLTTGRVFLKVFLEYFFGFEFKGSKAHCWRCRYLIRARLCFAASLSAVVYVRAAYVLCAAYTKDHGNSVFFRAACMRNNSNVSSDVLRFAVDYSWSL